MKERICFIDVVRIVAFLFIIYYHVLIQFILDDVPLMRGKAYLFQNSNMHIATLGVGLFFMISGMGLMVSNEDSFDLKTFWKKRFVRIYIPFYVTYILTYIFQRKLEGHALFTGISRLKLILTLTATDEYVSAGGIPTFSLGIGEWFLGCLILMYLVFPILRWALKKNAYVTMGIATVFYLVYVYVLPFHIFAVHMDYFVKLYEFLLGMFLAMNWKKIKRWSLCITVPIFLLYLFLPVAVPIPNGYKITILCVVCLLIFIQLEDLFRKHPGFMKGIRVAGNYSFEVYLIHHVVIRYVTDYNVSRLTSYPRILLLILIELVLMCLCGVIIREICCLPKRLRNLREKKNA